MQVLCLIILYIKCILKKSILKIESTILFGQFNQSKNIRNQKYFNWWEKLQGFVFFIFYFILLDMFIEGEKSLHELMGKIEKHEGKNMVDDYILDKIIDKIRDIIHIKILMIIKCW